MNIGNYPLLTIIFFLIVCLTLFYFLGLAVKKLMIRKNLASETSELGAIEGALLSLFGLFLAFAFSMAAERYNSRRATIIDEANAIGTAILRSDLYPDSLKKEFRSAFKIYLDSRIEYFDAGADTILVNKANLNSAKAQNKLWSIVGSSAQKPEYIEQHKLMVPAINAMFDAMTSRDAALKATVPDSVIWVLLLLSICSSFIVGYGSHEQRVNYIVGSIFVIMISVALTLIIDLDRPRIGLITTKEANSKITDLRSLFE